MRLQVRAGMENLKVLLVSLQLALASKRVVRFDDWGQNLDSLASSSAFSLPWMLMWAGIHFNEQDLLAAAYIYIDTFILIQILCM